MNNKINNFYTTEEYHSQQREKKFFDKTIFDYRFVDEFELLFIVSTIGEVRFGKKFNPNNNEQTHSILLENLGFSGYIDRNGKLHLKEGITTSIASEEEQLENKNTEEYEQHENRQRLSNQIWEDSKNKSQESIHSDLSTARKVRDTPQLLFDERETSYNDGKSSSSERLESLRGKRDAYGEFVSNSARGNYNVHSRGNNERNYIVPEVETDHLFHRRTKLDNNIHALKILIDLKKNNRIADNEEKIVLSNYSGFGGLAEILYEPDSYSFRKLNYTTQEYIRTIYNLIKEFDPNNENEVVKAVRSSSLTAFYTPNDVIRGIYDILNHAEYRGGSILEPSMGTGYFLGAMPHKFKENTNLFGVEIDYITGEIARHLYPDANIQITGFQQTKFPKNHFDIIIGNVPFGDIRVFDSVWKNSSLPIYKYAQQRIHNYFSVKSIELAKPNGIITFVTSSSVLDTPSNKMIREYIAENTEFLGAIRLPNDTFKNSNTEVTSDILFLRKFAVGEDKIQRHDFISLETAELANKNHTSSFDITYNKYFHEHPEMMLGTPCAGGQYREDSFTLLNDNSNVKLRERITDKAEFFITQGFVIGAKEENFIEDSTKHLLARYSGLDENIVKEGNFVSHNGTIGILKSQFNDNGERVLVCDPISTSINKERVISFIRLRNKLTKLMLDELCNESDEQIKTSRQELNKEYDLFTKKFERLNSRKNEFIREDIDAFTILALEKFDKQHNFIGLADIFTKRTINPIQKIEHADSPSQAILISLNEFGKIFPPKMEKLIGIDWKQQCHGLMFECPDSPDEFISKEEYLSGNVRTKLEQAMAAAKLDSRFQSNVVALTAVIPEDIPPALIDIRIGARWIPSEEYTDFFKHFFSIPQTEKEHGKVFYNSATDEYHIQRRKNNQNSTIDTLFAIAGKDGIELAEAALQDRQIRIFDKDEKGNSIFNPKATQSISEKIEKIKDGFTLWLSNDLPRREKLARLYNDIFNSIVIPKYDGSHLTLAGYCGPELRKHQKDCIWRNIRKNGGLIDHCVGAGKTLVMIVSAMEMKRIGLVNKAMIVALKPTVPSIAEEFRTVYPLAKILAPTEQDFSKKNRKKILGQIAINDWDCVILSHEQYCMLEHENHIEDMLMREELDLLRSTVLELENEENHSTDLTKRQRKGLEKRIENLTAKIQNILSRPTDEFTFEKLGIDHLFLDESHCFKNLSFATKHTNVAGLGDPDGSKKTKFLLMGCRALQEKYGEDKGVTFASGTPISNSLVELFLIFRYLIPNVLKEIGLTTFDSWASVFAERSSEIEFSVTGELKFKDRFRRFTNVPELAKMYASLADVRNDKNIFLPKPHTKIRLVNIKQSPCQQQIMQDIIEFAKHGESRKLGLIGDNYKKAKMLVATNLSAKVAMDVRLLNPELEDDERSKIHQCAKHAAYIYQESREHKGVQLLFSDLGTPSEKFNVYDEIKRKLIENHDIPPEEIAFIHDAKNEKQKLELFNKVRSGDIAFLLGSTGKMGTGTNIQDRIIAMHHLDVPWTPASFEQRNGRGSRQGNLIAEQFYNNSVQTNVYAVEKSLDAYKYQLLQIKQGLIEQVKDGSITDRCIDEGASDGNSFSFAEFVSILSGNPIILEKANVEKEIHQLYTSQRIFEEEKFHRKNKIANAKISLDKLAKDTSLASQDLNLFKANGYSKRIDGSYNFCVSVDNIVYDKPSEVGKIILEKVNRGELGKVLTGYGVDMFLSKEHSDTVTYRIIAPSGHIYGNKELSQNPTFAGMSIINAIEQAERLTSRRDEIPEIERQIRNLEGTMSEEWKGMDRLQSLLSRQREINAELNSINNTQETTIDISHEVCDSKSNTIVQEVQEKKINQPVDISPKIIHIDKCVTKEGTDIWIAKFDVTFEREIYKDKVEPIIIKHNGFWSKFCKGVVFKDNVKAETFKDFITNKIIDDGILYSKKIRTSPMTLPKGRSIKT